uniref:type VII secretion protein EccE n=1 Tax=Cumulibacter manganitolerans TaxID=1884992 RepID=UPI001E5B86A5
ASAVCTSAPAMAERRRIVEPPVEIRQRRWGGLHPGQVVAAEAAVVAAAAGSRSPWPVLLPVVLATAAVLACCFVRLRGRWLYEWLGTALRYLVRTRAGTLDEQRPVDGVLAATTHGGALRRLEIDGAEVAVLTDSTGYTAVLEVVPDGADPAGGQRLLPPLGELLPHNEPGDVPISVQVVTHTVPAPSVAAADDAAAHSYRELGGGQIPSRRRTWLCVQAMHSAEVPTPRAVEQALINAVRRIQRRMRKSGFRPRVRSVRETAADLLGLVRVDPGQPADGPAVRERWGRWTAGRATHVTYRVSGWPALADRAAAGPLIDGIDSVPATSRTSSLAGRRVGELVDVEAVLRFTTAEGAGQRAVDDALGALLRGSGAVLQRLDGDHRFGVGATLPTGGFAV